MSNRAVSLTLGQDSDTLLQGDWATLDQPVDNSSLKMGDIYEMWILAKTGKSARTYKPAGHPVGFDNNQTKFTLYFDVFPSRMDLDYKLTTTLGTIQPDRKVVDNPRSIGVIFDHIDSYEFDRLFNDYTTEPLTPSYTSDGTAISTPELTLNKNILSSPVEFFGVFRFEGRESGYRHAVDIIIDNVDEAGNNVQIEDLECTVTVSWQGVEDVETVQLTLELPKNIQYALNICAKKPNMICRDCKGSIAKVYFSTCDGDVLGVNIVPLYEPDEDKWCVTV